MSRIDEVLEGLINRTAEEKLAWQTSADTNAFVAAVGGISIVIRSQNRILIIRHRLEIQNDDGTTVQVLQTRDDSELVSTEDDATPEQARKLSHLYALARRSALKTDTTLDELAESLANFP
ncbi:MAG: hypothetical protein OXC95_07860 [Dehalococcoidia bacterium]|nr:hypothetical protein [Dehalococcoidia bacterium]